MSDSIPDGLQPAAEPTGAERDAIDAALNFLSYRQRTREEVRRKLSERGFEPGVVEVALERLKSVGLIDDAAFVGAYVRDRIAHRPMGIRRMVQELYRKGVPREVALPLIEEVLADEGTDERELASRIVRRKHRSLARRPGDPRQLMRRVKEHLLRRGFGQRTASEAVDEHLDSA